MPANPRQRALEFLAFFVVLPLVIALALPPEQMFTALFAGTLVGLILLARTEGFHWRALFTGARQISWALVAATALVTALISYGVLMLWAPEAFFALLGPDAPRIGNGPPLILMIALLYPILSALPQELVFRMLYFQRYGDMLPRGTAGLLLNGALFSLAHLMYWSLVVTVLTFAGGVLFAWSHKKRGNFPEAVILHSVAGVVLFAMGMGVYFYSGNVERPF